MWTNQLHERWRSQKDPGQDESTYFFMAQGLRSTKNLVQWKLVIPTQDQAQEHVQL